MTANALEVKKKCRGEKLGSLLWAIGSLFVFQETSQPIFITDTTDKTVRKDSFYVRWGATKTADSTVLYRLHPEQISLLELAGVLQPKN